MRYKFHQIGFILIMTILVTALSASCQMQGMSDQKNTMDITSKEAYNHLLNTSMEMAYLDTMISLSQWDQDISMPQNATKYRAKAQGHMEDLKNKKWIDPEFGRLLSIANNGSNWSLIETANLRLWNRDYSKRIKLPPDLAMRESEMVSKSLAAWENAREENNYSIFQPHLKELIELNREKARAWGYEEHPYDALLDDFMPGMTAAKCDKLFETIKPHIIELIVKIKESGINGSDTNVYGNASYPKDKQEALLRNLTAALGFDYSAGIMVKAKRNPSTYGIGVHDVRTSLRYDEHNPEIALLDVIHECGHGIAAQRIPDEYVGMPIAVDPGMDMAEAEARLFENNLGRSMAFWQYWLPQMKNEFRPNMDNVSVDEMHRCINRLNIIPIRIDADEVSYIIHIIIRYEIERDLFEGKISVDDLPMIWKQKYKEYLGLNITDDNNGILQDVHWAYGNFGYFPAYAIASMNSAQLEGAMRRDHPDLDQRFASGDFSIPANWMEEHVYRYGGVFDTPELMKRATGNETEAYDFLSYLDSKYGKIYNLISIAPLSAGYSDQPDKKNVKITHFINGAQGDKSFFDSAVRGIAKAEEDFHLEVTTIEAGYDTTLWKRMIEDAASNKDYDIMIVGTTPMLELLENVAQMHPDKKFIIYDSCVNYTDGRFANVYSILYRQNEGAYLAGVYAGLMTKSNIIGILGGQNSTVINDFVIGYEQGARSVRPDINIMVQYAESWNDLAKGEALAKVMYEYGADIVFQVAGTTGMGVFNAAQKLDQYAIGVDSDQALLIEKTDLEQSRHIPTSMMKNVDKSLYHALGLYIDGQLPFGRAETLGIKEGAVGLAKSKYYQEITPTEVKAKINQTEIDILECRIKVETAF